MSLQAQVVIIIMVVGLVLGGIVALSDRGRGLVTYLFFRPLAARFWFQCLAFNSLPLTRS
jgi:hypothetical protein